MTNEGRSPSDARLASRTDSWAATAQVGEMRAQQCSVETTRYAHDVEFSESSETSTPVLQNASSAHASTASRLLLLPTELRLMIYECTFAVTLSEDHDLDRQACYPLPPLLQVCRTTRIEGAKEGLNHLCQTYEIEKHDGLIRRKLAVEIEILCRRNGGTGFYETNNGNFIVYELLRAHLNGLQRHRACKLALMIRCCLKFLHTMIEWHVCSSLPCKVQECMTTPDPHGCDWIDPCVNERQRRTADAARAVSLTWLMSAIFQTTRTLRLTRLGGKGTI